MCSNRDTETLKANEMPSVQGQEGLQQRNVDQNLSWFMVYVCLFRRVTDSGSISQILGKVVSA